MSLSLLLAVAMAATALVMLACVLGFHWPALHDQRIHDDSRRKVSGAPRYKRAAANMALSGGFVFGFAHLLQPWLFVTEPSGWAPMVVRGVGILLLYDFTYYLMHRFAFHRWSALRSVHVVHHAVRHPTAVDSVYLHPVETVLGVALLIACTWVLGPVDPITFTVLFFVFSAVNVVVHSGLQLRRFPFRALGHMARVHDTHHTSMKAGNYASITPIWDILFGTAE